MIQGVTACAETGSEPKAMTATGALIATEDRRVLRAVEVAMSDWAERRCSDEEPAEVRNIRAHLRDHSAKPLDYDRHAAAFACAFHMVNYRKVLTALRAARPPRTADIIDLGCGSGAGAAAAIAYFAAHGGIDGSIHVSLLDRSRAQLDFASDAVARAARAVGADAKLQRLLDQLPTQGPAENLHRAGLVLAAHVLTENAGRETEILDAARRIARPEGSILIVERPDDPVWDAVERYVRQSSLCVSSGIATVEPVSGIHNSRRWGVRWLLVQNRVAPIDSVLRHRLDDVVERYLRAWRCRDPELLTTVFAADAVYADKPFHEPLKGIEQIKEYWRREVATQDQLEIKIQKVAYAADSAFVEWFVTFRRDQLDWTLAGALILEVDRQSSLVTELREYYRTMKVAAGEKSG
jgi:SAM-dependent methyltransferase